MSLKLADRMPNYLHTDSPDPSLLLLISGCLSRWQYAIANVAVELQTIRSCSAISRESTGACAGCVEKSIPAQFGARGIEFCASVCIRLGIVQF